MSQFFKLTLGFVCFGLIGLDPARGADTGLADDAQTVQAAQLSAPERAPAPQGSDAAQSQSENTKQPRRSERKGFYVAIRGYSAIEDQNNLEFDNSTEVGVAVGLRPANNWRLEAERARRRSDIVGLNGASNARGTAKVDSIGMHVFYDFREGHKLRPFVGLGAGFQDLTFEFEGTADINPDFTVTASDRNQSYYINGFLGAGYRVTRDFQLTGGFEYVTGSDQAVESNIGDIHGINRSYNFFVGGRYFFSKGR